MNRKDMNLDDLFCSLDVDKDGTVSRKDLDAAAKGLRWGWREAPYFAVLDLLTVDRPLTRDVLAALLDQISQDPNGPYGEALLKCSFQRKHDRSNRKNESRRLESPGRGTEGIVALLSRVANALVADEYSAILGSLKTCQEPLHPGNSAFFVIDPQRSFTEGAWMRSIGRNAKSEVEPIRLAFENCSRLLREARGRIETMFSRCPFPPESYGWDERVTGLIDERQHYFIKPDNSLLWPPTNGFENWVGDLLARGKAFLVLGGCTLNSCVRVSAIEVHQRFSNRGLQVIVTLDVCGARTSNYTRSEAFGGLSSVETAIGEMKAAGVWVVPYLEWF